MMYWDPWKIYLSGFIAIPLGLMLGFGGLAMLISAAIAKKGFERSDHLVTTGIYSKLRNPMYIGMILIHLGFPFASRSLLTFLSTIIWIPFILIWKYMEERDLEKRFGEAYVEYKKRTYF